MELARLVSGARDDNGTAQGECVLAWGDDAGPLAGQRYEGQVVDGEFEGVGTLTASDADADRVGRTYEGQWVHGVREGEGVSEFDDGQHYHGQFVADERCGEGKYSWGKTRYDGEWAHNEMHGGGALAADGTKYVGQFRAGQKHGRGTFTFADGAYYTGGFVDDQSSSSVSALGTIPEDAIGDSASAAAGTASDRLRWLELKIHHPK